MPFIQTCSNLSRDFLAASPCFWARRETPAGFGPPHCYEARHKHPTGATYRTGCLHNVILDAFRTGAAITRQTWPNALSIWHARKPHHRSATFTSIFRFIDAPAIFQAFALLAESYSSPDFNSHRTAVCENNTRSLTKCKNYF